MAKHGTTSRYNSGCRCEPCTSAHMADIGSAGGNSTYKILDGKRMTKKQYFREIARRSHRKNNPNAKERTNKGGRPKGSTKNVVAQG